MSGRLEGKVAFVTGAGRGIGRAIAERFVREGARVAVADKDPRTAEKTARELGASATAVPLDVSDSAAVKAAVDGFAEKMGRLDILVNNAGITRASPVDSMPEREWEQVLGVNLRGAFACTRAALRHMVRQSAGRIVCITSSAGVAGEPEQANDASAKGGLISFTKSIAQEVASRNITANAVAPGFITTPLTDLIPRPDRDVLVQAIPVSRPGTAEEVAAAVVFLASDEAGYITGEILHVNGGALMS